MSPDTPALIRPLTGESPVHLTGRLVTKKIAHVQKHGLCADALELATDKYVVLKSANSICVTVSSETSSLEQLLETPLGSYSARVWHCQ